MPLTLPNRTHGRSTTEPSNTIHVPAGSRSWLSRLFAGEGEFSAFPAAAIPLGRHPPAEAAAVARALGCPDLFLLDIPERIARERVLVQLLRSAAASGERLLVLSPDPAAADRLVETLASDRTLRVVRALADDENPLRPSQLVSRLTGSAAGTNRAEQLKRDAAQTVSDLEAKLARLERAQEFRAKLDEIERERSTLADRLVTAEKESRGAAERLAILQKERSALQVRRAECERTSKPGFFARVFGFGKHADSQSLQEIIALDAKLAAECNSLSQQSAESVEKAIGAESAVVAARRAELDAEAARIERAIREFLPRATMDDTVENCSLPPAVRAELEHELAVARTRHQELTSAGPDLARRLLAETQIAIGTPGSLECDPVFPALASASPPFDRLVLDHAEELTESAFDHLSALASRWVLAGDASPPQDSGRPRSRPLEPSLLCQLARRLDFEPWSVEGDRLVVRLAHLAQAERATLVREPLIDHPDVELSVLSGDDEPILAEISFPANTAIPAAKSFLFTQLGEVVLRPCGDHHWHRREECLTVCWPLFDSAEGEWVELEPGIREHVVGRGITAFTAAVTFDCSSGWDEAAAEAWLAIRVRPAASRVAGVPADIHVPRPAYTR